MDEQIIERAVEAAAKAHRANAYATTPSEWDGLDDDVKTVYRDDVRSLVAAALAEVEGSLTAERDELRRWKEEALPVLAGLQDLGRALDVPLGERITGKVAAKRAEELAARVARVEAERDRLKRGGHTLGKIIDRWGEAIITATGSESLVDEDRDGDWQVIEERLAGLRPELVDLRARVARVEALHVDGLGDCRECDYAWPCPTIKALRGESDA